MEFVESSRAVFGIWMEVPSLLSTRKPASASRFTITGVVKLLRCPSGSGRRNSSL